MYICNALFKGSTNGLFVFSSVLQEYTGNEVFIIGANIDLHRHKPESYLRAKKHGIRMASLPISDYCM